MNRLCELKHELKLVHDIVIDLRLADDAEIGQQLAEVNIELEGISVRHSTVSQQTATLLSEVHAHSITVKLELVARSALAYYSMVDQPDGINEPPVGPQDALQLNDRLQKRSINLMDIKDELHRLTTPS